MAGVGTNLTVGGRLRSAREAKGVSVEEANRLTKIQKRVLEAIEENRVEEILDPVYVKIFVKKYASFLGVDGSALLQEYLTTHPVGPSGSPRLTVQTGITSQPERPPLPWWVAPAGILLLGLIGVGVMGTLVVDLVANVRAQRGLVPGPEATAAAKAPEREFLVPLSKPLQLAIQSTGDVWLQVKADGAVIFQGVLSKGSREGWTAKRELELWTGNAGAMQLSLNGKTLEGLGRGVKKGIRITHRGIEER